MSERKPLKIDDIAGLSDGEFIDLVYQRNSFTFRGRTRRFKYRTTNEAINDLMGVLDIQEGQSVLAVSGSGVQIFEALTQERTTPKQILAFDYSPKQLAYNYLLKAGIQSLTFREFRAYFGLTQIDWDRKLTRKVLISRVPQQFRSHLPRKHTFNKRDLALDSLNNLTWNKIERSYIRVKKNLERIKFFEYELNHKNLVLAKIFEKHSFDRVYLSNVLDWFCWHNSHVVSPDLLISMLQSIGRVVKTDGFIVLCHLVNRRSVISDVLANLRKVRITNNKLHKYKWAAYRLPLSDLKFPRLR